MNSGPNNESKEMALIRERGCIVKWLEKAPQFFPALFFATCFMAAWIWRVAVSASPTLDTIVVSAAAIATLLALNQRLPLQNIVGVVVTISVFWWATLLIAKMSGVFIYPPLLSDFFREYEIGLFWVIGLINARGIAKLILNAWRRNGNYGLWLIAVSSLLVTAEDARARQNLAYFVEKLLFVAVIFASATPWFIDKKGIEQKPDFQPLLITIGLLLW